MARPAHTVYGRSAGTVLVLSLRVTRSWVDLFVSLFCFVFFGKFGALYFVYTVTPNHSTRPASVLNSQSEHRRRSTVLIVIVFWFLVFLIVCGDLWVKLLRKRCTLCVVTFYTFAEATTTAPNALSLTEETKDVGGDLISYATVCVLVLIFVCFYFSVLLFPTTSFFIVLYILTLLSKAFYRTQHSHFGLPFTHLSATIIYNNLKPFPPKRRERKRGR